MEDKQLAFTANIAELRDATLRLRKNLMRSQEKEDVTYAQSTENSCAPIYPREQLASSFDATTGFLARRGTDSRQSSWPIPASTSLDVMMNASEEV